MAKEDCRLLMFEGKDYVDRIIKYRKISKQTKSNYNNFI